MKNTHYILLGIMLLFHVGAGAQNNMRPVDALINRVDPGWPLVQGWIKQAKNKVEVLPADSARAREALYQVQVTTRSPMGAVVFETGGILIDDGWIRILGSGSARLDRSLPGWNLGKTFRAFGERSPYLLVADDAIGGFFLLNGGGLGPDLGKIYYFSPDNLEYEPLSLSYTEFLSFCLNGEVGKFYEGLRWKGWRDDMAKLDGNQVFVFYPFLWSKEGKDVGKASRKVSGVEEQYIFQLGARKQLGMDK